MDQVTLLRRLTGEERLLQTFKLTKFVLTISKRAKRVSIKGTRKQYSH